MDLTLVPYQHQNRKDSKNGVVKYKECMKNHAASIGGHANDGCGEFMPRFDDTNNLSCAACGCHRNFHRREGTSAVAACLRQHSLHFEHLMLSPPPIFSKGVHVTLSKKHSHSVTSHDHFDDLNEDNNDDHDRRSETPERGEVNEGGVAGKAKNKRFRTKFTQEQKDRMLEFAEKIGWRINRNDDIALNQFCSEVGVKRNVLKIWMHNNKNVHRRKHAQQPSTVAVPPPQAVGV